MAIQPQAFPNSKMCKREKSISWHNNVIISPWACRRTYETVSGLMGSSWRRFSQSWISWRCRSQQLIDRETKREIIITQTFKKLWIWNDYWMYNFISLGIASVKKYIYEIQIPNGDGQCHSLFWLTFECDDGSHGGEAQGVGVTDQVIGLQSVGKGNPHQITKCQHEAKTIVHQIHGGQDGLLR